MGSQLLFMLDTNYAIDRFVGFEEFGNQDNFDTSVIEMKLLETGMIPCQALQVDVSSQ